LSWFYFKLLPTDPIWTLLAGCKTKFNSTPLFATAGLIDPRLLQHETILIPRRALTIVRVFGTHLTSRRSRFSVAGSSGGNLSHGAATVVIGKGFDHVHRHRTCSIANTAVPVSLKCESNFR